MVSFGRHNRRIGPFRQRLFADATRLTRSKPAAYPAGSPGPGRVGLGRAGSCPDRRFIAVHDRIEELKAAVAGLEAAVKARLVRAHRDQEELAALRAEVETLRSMQRNFANRLDDAIARLRTTLDD